MTILPAGAPTLNVAIYARVSTAHQDAGLQLAELRRYAEARAFSIAGEFVDHGYSGATISRPALDRLMAAARSRAVLVRWFDRVSRCFLGRGRLAS